MQKTLENWWRVSGSKLKLSVLGLKMALVFDGVSEGLLGGD